MGPHFPVFRSGGFCRRSLPLSWKKACFPTCVVTRPATLIWPGNRPSRLARRGRKSDTDTESWWGGRGEYPLTPPHCFPETVQPWPSSTPLPAPVSLAATVKVSGWPEPDRTGHRLGRVKRKRRGAVAPPPVQQARLRERERERRATYAVCIAERAGGGARAGRLGSARAGLGRSSPAPV